jgi:large subunit ribosomal protein L1
MAKKKDTAETPAPEKVAEKPAEKSVEKKPAEKKPEAPATPTPGPASSSSADTKKKGRRPGVPPRRGKKLRGTIKTSIQKIPKEPVPLPKAIALLKQLKRAKFDETVEVHMWLGIDTTQSEQMIRGSVGVPHGLGKVKRVVVFCQGDNIQKAKDAGADYAGADDLIEKIQKEGWLDFDVALATQDLMGKVSRLGKVLGPRGLMPTPKAGTVIPLGQDIIQAVKEQKAGKVEYRSDKGGNVHAGLGKLSFDEKKLVENIMAFIDQIRAAKPAGVKGNYIKAIYVAATMTPGIPVSV